MYGVTWAIHWAAYHWVVWIETHEITALGDDADGLHEQSDKLVVYLEWTFLGSRRGPFCATKVLYLT